MRKIGAIIVFFLCAVVCYGQTHNSADRLFQDGLYAEAGEEYAALLKSYPSYPLYLYRYARCAQELGDDTTALQYFEKAGDRYMLKYFYMGESYMRLWQAENAITAYNTYLNSLKEPNERDAHIQQQIAKAEKLQRYLRRVEQVCVLDSVDVPLKNLLDACVLSSQAGKLSYTKLGEIVFTNQLGDRQLWGSASDSVQYIVSSYRLLDHWSKPDTLPETVNMSERQLNPYVLNDGVTLYYAAADSNGLGGLDLYITRYNPANESYTIPENLGFPYNSPGNEYLLAIDEGKHIGYLATDRFTRGDSVRVYTFQYTQQKQYWRNIPADSLAAYARLQRFVKAEIEDLPRATTTRIDTTTSIPAFSFVINDSVVYHSIQDFRSPVAKKTFLQWQESVKRYEAEQERLAALRLAYSEADESKQKELTPIILQLENNQGPLMLLCEELLQQARKAEIDNTQQ